MTGVARVVRLLALVVWVGGIVFFAFAVAPVAFAVLPTAHVAGLAVAGCLRTLDGIGGVCAVLLLGATAVLSRGGRLGRVAFAEAFLIALMAAATAAIHWGIVPRMERDRIAAGGDIDAAAATDPARIDFERLHPISERLEGAALLLGLGLIVTIGIEPAAVSRPG